MLAHTLLIARHFGVDLEAAIYSKWLKETRTGPRSNTRSAAAARGCCEGRGHAE